jgi:hypothetical protein
MKIEEHIPLLEDILGEWKNVIGEDYEKYKNHCTRMIQCCWVLKTCNEEKKKKIIIASAFHDIGLWTENTLDYIPPSIPLAMEYLMKNNLESWSEEIELMISEHHKLREYEDTNYPLVEVFRKGDLVDFSLGFVKFGIPEEFINELKVKIPNAGFHKMLLIRATKWFSRHPLNPAPMMKW